MTAVPIVQIRSGAPLSVFTSYVSQWRPQFYWFFTSAEVSSIPGGSAPARPTTATHIPYCSRGGATMWNHVAAQGLLGMRERTKAWLSGVLCGQGSRERVLDRISNRD